MQRGKEQNSQFGERSKTVSADGHCARRRVSKANRAAGPALGPEMSADGDGF